MPTARANGRGSTPIALTTHQASAYSSRKRIGRKRVNVSPAFFSVNAMNDAKDGAASCEHAPARSREGSLFYLLSAGFSAGLSAVFSADSLPDAFCAHLDTVLRNG